MTRPKSNRYPSYRVRRRPKPVYGPPTYTYGTPINDYIFSGSHDTTHDTPPYDYSLDYGAPPVKTIHTGSSGGNIGAGYKYSKIKTYKDAPQPPKHSSSYPRYQSENSQHSYAPPKSFGEPPQTIIKYSSSSEYAPAQPFPIQSDTNYMSPPSTSYGVPIAPVIKVYPDDSVYTKSNQPPQAQIQDSYGPPQQQLHDAYGPPHQQPHDAYAPPQQQQQQHDTYRPPVTSYDAPTYDGKSNSGKFAEPPPEEYNSHGISESAHEQYVPQSHPPRHTPNNIPQTSYKPANHYEEPLYNAAAEESGEEEHDNQYLPPTLPDSYDQNQFAFPKSNHHNPSIYSPAKDYGSYVDYGLYGNGQESKKVLTKKPQPFSFKNNSSYSNVDIPSDDYVDDLLHKSAAGTTTTTTKKPTKRRSRYPPTTNTPHILDTDDLRDAFSSGSASYSLSVQPENEGNFGARTNNDKRFGKQKNNQEVKNFVLLAATNNRTTDVTTEPSVRSAPTSSESINNVNRVKNSRNTSRNKPKDIQIISIQKSQSHSYYAGTVPPPYAKGKGSGNSLKPVEGSFNVATSNVQVQFDRSGAPKTTKSNWRTTLNRSKKEKQKNTISEEQQNNSSSSSSDDEDKSRNSDAPDNNTEGISALRYQYWNEDDLPINHKLGKRIF